MQMLKAYFSILDIRQVGELDDIQFLSFLRDSTDLTQGQAYKVFDMFDVDDSGSIEFDEFYLICCMLIAIKDECEKEFLWRHCRTCFELLDEDGSDSVSIYEFETFGFMFNISKRASRMIFRDFDVDNSKELDYEEFRMFTLACIDKQQRIDEEKLQRTLTQKNTGYSGVFGTVKTQEAHRSPTKPSEYFGSSGIKDKVTELLPSRCNIS